MLHGFPSEWLFWLSKVSHFWSINTSDSYCDCIVPQIDLVEIRFLGSKTQNSCRLMIEFDPVPIRYPSNISIQRFLGSEKIKWDVLCRFIPR